MNVDTMAHVRAHLSEVLDSVEKTHERVMITRNGKPSAVLVAAEEWDALLETLEVLSDPQTIKNLAEADAQFERGETYTLDDVKSEMTPERRRAVFGE